MTLSTDCHIFPFVFSGGRERLKPLPGTDFETKGVSLRWGMFRRMSSEHKTSLLDRVSLADFFDSFRVSLLLSNLLTTVLDQYKWRGGSKAEKLFYYDIFCYGTTNFVRCP
jgi:hypothetical protein